MIDYEEDYISLLLLKRSGSVACKASLWAVPSAVLAVVFVYIDEWMPGARDDVGLKGITQSQLWNAMTVIIILLLGFRTRQALSRFWEGTGLLHQMRGEWFDTVSNCVSFSSTARKIKKREVEEFRHTLVRLMSLAHGSALEEIAEGGIQCEALDVLGLDSPTLNFIRDCHLQKHFNRVEVILHVVQTLIVHAHEDGILKIPPPILSRVFQTISRGFVNLLNAKKITDTRFPFPYAQLIAFLLLCMNIMIPMTLSAIVHSKILVAIFTYVPILGMMSLNYIAIELENPFGTDTNDLPLSHFQEDMNKCMLMLLHGDSDVVAGLANNYQDFATLYRIHVEKQGESDRRERVKRFSDFNADVRCERSTTIGYYLSDGANDESPNVMISESSNFSEGSRKRDQWEPLDERIVVLTSDAESRRLVPEPPHENHSPRSAVPPFPDEIGHPMPLRSPLQSPPSWTPRPLVRQVLKPNSDGRAISPKRPALDAEAYV